MNIRLYAAAATAVLALGAACAASATPVVLTGNYVNTGISDSGTLGSNGNTSPGLQHDPTGMKNFGVNDYITPGSPHEGFSINSNETGFQGNDNQFGAGGGAFLTTTGPTVISGAYDHMATWTGASGDLSITNLYYFNDGDQRVNILTTLTALTDLTNLAFARSVDPDPDVNTSGSYDTLNQRGNALFSAFDFVGSAGQTTGLTLGLLNLSGNTYTHNTAIDGNCCSNQDPYGVLTGYDAGPLGDYGLHMAWSIGDLATGKSASINYAYVVGEHIGTVGGGGVPEPATWAMMLIGFGGIGAVVRRRRVLSVA
ncbi:PEPxxWA-CTERM sorting domain-containing protein [Phenylobacterium sp.]|uniref:PEPxxWA-CTERM sorting domain-containing protein n=1 Tax=Phenylobacterium sp. TaxID=1871053 RepID=UPI0025CD8CEE|nr:PEPxxWA-CTERM sorting domain-containing protein [Phenylobacterium sp.]